MTLSLTLTNTLSPTLGGGGIPKPIIDNVISELDFTDASAYTFSSGIVISGVSAIEGIDFENVGVPEYDATAFSGRGGVRITGVGDCVRHVSDFTASAVGTFIIVLSTPTYSVSGDLLSYATGTANGNSAARIAHLGVGNIVWSLDQANADVTLLSGGTDGFHIIAMRFNNATDADAFVDGSSETVTFDPNNNYSARTRIRLGSRAATLGAVNARMGYFVQTSDVLTDQEIADYYTYLSSKFGA